MDRKGWTPMDDLSLTVQCPECGQPPGLMCRVQVGPLSGHPTLWPHVQRINAPSLRGGVPLPRQPEAGRAAGDVSSVSSATSVS